MDPGEVYMADLGEATPHPVIIVSREDLSRGDRAVAVLCTSQKFAVRSNLPHCVPLGLLDAMALRDVIKAIGHVIDSDCEPN